MNNNPKISTIVRTTMLFIALLNQLLITNGKEILPIKENDLYVVLSTSATIILSIVNWWKNNSFTQNAIKADTYLQKIKKVK